MPPKVMVAFLVLGFMAVALFIAICMIGHSFWVTAIAVGIFGIHALILAVWWLIQVAKGRHLNVPDYHPAESPEAPLPNPPSIPPSANGPAELDWRTQPPRENDHSAEGAP